LKPAPRTAGLVLVTPDGAVLGSLPPIPVSTPWWQDAEPVVAAIRDRYGLEVTILRLLDAEFERPHGGLVMYLGELAHASPIRSPIEPWSGSLDAHPKRLPYARPGGPAADLSWARSVLIKHGLQPAGPPVQVRSWNLSSLWRLPVDGQTVWLKVVPPFFAHEGGVLARLAGEQVPTLLGHDGCRVLLAEVPGDDLYDAELPLLLDMVKLLVDLQQSRSAGTDELLALGLPDWRAPRLAAAIADVTARTAHELTAEDQSTLERFVRDLPRRFAEVTDCGLADTLVHGDFHPGNFRGDNQALTLLDWGDSGVGHPFLDQPAFLDRIPQSAIEAVCEQWARLWRELVPGSDPGRASLLIAPVAAARQAVIYRGFLDAIEPAEHPYHQADPVDWLRRTVTLVRAEAGALASSGFQRPAPG
jgi:hypothetical protein